MDIWLWKVGLTPRPITHGPRDGHLSSSGAVESLRAGLPLGDEFERWPSRGPYPGSMPKLPISGLSRPPLWLKRIVRLGSCSDATMSCVPELNTAFHTPHLCALMPADLSHQFVGALD